MKPILRAHLNACDARGLTLDCGGGIAMRIVALADDLVRVTALRGGEVRQKRTWAVPAFGEADTDWEGRARLDDYSQADRDHRRRLAYVRADHARRHSD